MAPPFSPETPWASFLGFHLDEYAKIAAWEFLVFG